MLSKKNKGVPFYRQKSKPFKEWEIEPVYWFQLTAKIVLERDKKDCKIFTILQNI